MSCPKHKKTISTDIIASRILSKLFSVNIVKFGLATLCLSFATTSMAVWNDNPPTETAYVDSIHQWGAWELDIEPAAGGITPASTKALNARDPKVSLRINSIAALAPQAAVTFNSPTAPIVPPVVPVIPPVPPVTPPRPAAPTNFAPPGATPPVVVTLPPKFK